MITAAGECLPQSFGGNCLYGALGARLWCDDVGVASRCGNNYPPAAFDLMRDTGIDASGVTRLDRPHGRNMAFAYRADGSRTREIPPAVAARIPVPERERFIDTTLLPDAEQKWLEFAPGACDMPAGWWPYVRGIHCAFMPVVRHREIAAAARSQSGQRIWMQIDSPWHDRKAPAIDHASALFHDIDAVLPSEADLEQCRPGAEFEQAVAALLDRGAKIIVLKRGAAGCAIYEAGRGRIALIPALDVVAVDPTGAGDAFCGGFLAGLHLTGDVVTAARYGTVSASFAVESAGLARLAEASRSEAAARLATVSPNTSIGPPATTGRASRTQ